MPQSSTVARGWAQFGQGNGGGSGGCGGPVETIVSDTGLSLGPEGRLGGLYPTASKKACPGECGPGTLPKLCNRDRIPSAGHYRADAREKTAAPGRSTVRRL